MIGVVSFQGGGTNSCQFALYIIRRVKIEQPYSSALHLKISTYMLENHMTRLALQPYPLYIVSSCSRSHHQEGRCHHFNNTSCISGSCEPGMNRINFMLLLHWSATFRGEGKSLSGRMCHGFPTITHGNRSKGNYAETLLDSFRR